jgi:hypothetical protein
MIYKILFCYVRSQKYVLPFTPRFPIGGEDDQKRAAGG